MLQTEHLTFQYGKGTPFETTALDDVSFSVEEGQCMGVIGHTGSGKSTLIQHLNGLLKPQSGRILLDGQDIWEKKNTIRQLRFAVGLVFQYPEYQLFEETVEKDIAFGPKAMGLPPEEINLRVAEAMETVGLGTELSGKSPFELSGGQKRRAAIAGVIAMRPRVLILDEPTAGLDPEGRYDILQKITAYRKHSGAAVILVTHSMEDIARTVDDITVLGKGKIFSRGSLQTVFGERNNLREIGLDVPTVTRIMLRLKEMGLPVDVNVYTQEDAKKAILSLRQVTNP